VGWMSGLEVTGYEIHLGRLELLEGTPAFTIEARNGERCDQTDGAVAGNVTGTLIHGLFENDDLRARLLDDLRARRGLPPRGSRRTRTREAEYDRLAATLRAHLDLELLLRQILAGRVRGSTSPTRPGL
jgi:adenosylcobyric acid synthase